MTPAGATTWITPNPWSEFAQGFAEGWTQGANAAIRKTAHEAYQAGLADIVTIPPGAGLQGNFYFARPRGLPPTLTLRLVGLGLEVPFVWEVQ